MKKLLKRIVVKLLMLEAKVLLDRKDPTVVVVTGSVGKTSTKDAISLALKNQGKDVRSSAASFNSDIGLPLTILGLENMWSSPVGWSKNLLVGAWRALFQNDYPEIVVLEIGAETPGSISTMAKWLHVDVLVLTRFPSMPVHASYFNSPEDVIKEKLSLLKSLVDNAVVVLNSDDKKVLAVKHKWKGKTVTFGVENEADVQAVRIEHENLTTGRLGGVTFSINDNGTEHTVHLKGVVGSHHAYSLLAGLCVAQVLDLKKETAIANLSQYKPPKGRLNVLKGLKGSVILDDTYNSSPTAVQAGLDTLKEVCPEKSNRICIIGEMLELGDVSDVAHRNMGEHAGKVCGRLYVVGDSARYVVEGALAGGLSDKTVLECKDAKKAGKKVESELAAGDVVFIKGSQGVRMERATQEIMAHPELRHRLLVRQSKEWLNR